MEQFGVGWQDTPKDTPRVGPNRLQEARTLAPPPTWIALRTGLLRGGRAFGLLLSFMRNGNGPPGGASPMLEVQGARRTLAYQRLLFFGL